MEGTGNRVAIITGAAAGIGEETSYGFAKQGLSVVLVDVNAEGLVKVADKIKNMDISPDKIMTITADLSQESSYESVIKQTITKFGQIDVLVNNAGIAHITPFESLTFELVDNVYQVMLKAPLFLSQKAFPHLKKTKGCIINVASGASRVALAGMMDYCTVKAGLEHLTRCLALEGGSHGIRVNSVHPGAVKTSLFNESPHENMATEKSALLGRLGTVAEIASAIVYLASDGASFITGTSLFVDGGIVLAHPTHS